MMIVRATWPLVAVALLLGLCVSGWIPAIAEELTEPPRQANDVSVEDRGTNSTTPLDQALADLDQNTAPSNFGDALGAAPGEGGDPGDLFSRRVGDLQLRLVDLSVDLLVAAGGSSERDEALESLQGGGHDPRKRGFTLQNVELSLLGAVDPFFTTEVHLIYFLTPLENESVFELEEAFITTSQLPFDLQEVGFQLELGHFFTEFGRINPQHPHAWDWLDQPVILTRAFGPDGMRGAGFRLGWLTPLPWFAELHFGMQNAAGETMASFLANDEFFEERPIGGRPFVERDVRSLEDFAYLARFDNSWDLTQEITSKVGLSALVGPNATGPDGYTVIYGADFVVKWNRVASDQGWPFVIWQSEILKRSYRTDDFSDSGDPADPTDDVVLGDTTLRDWGLYTQILYGFVRDWAAGIRFECAGGSGQSLGGSSQDPFRDDRYRVAPLLAWMATEYSRVRLQYNYDYADHIDNHRAHSVWLGFEVLLGSHPAHSF